MVTLTSELSKWIVSALERGRLRSLETSIDNLGLAEPENNLNI
jgi:hypothetical protein